MAFRASRVSGRRAAAPACPRFPVEPGRIPADRCVVGGPLVGVKRRGDPSDAI